MAAREKWVVAVPSATCWKKTSTLARQELRDRAADDIGSDRGLSGTALLKQSHCQGESGGCWVGVGRVDHSIGEGCGRVDERTVGGGCCLGEPRKLNPLQLQRLSRALPDLEIWIEQEDDEHREKWNRLIRRQVADEMCCLGPYERIDVEEEARDVGRAPLRLLGAIGSQGKDCAIAQEAIRMAEHLDELAQMLDDLLGAEIPEPTESYEALPERVVAGQLFSSGAMLRT